MTLRDARADANKVLGPVVGGFLVADLGWRWTFWLILIIVSQLASLLVRQPEGGLALTTIVLGRINNAVHVRIHARDIRPNTSHPQSRETAKRDWQ
jgi:MFS family permease